MDNYTIIEDVFDNGGRNQLTEARGFLGTSHVPEDMRPPSKRFHRDSGMKEELPPIPPLRNIQAPPTNISFEQMGPDMLSCRDVFLHVENCPLCKSYFKNDIKFYWLIIAILIVIIILLTRKTK